MILKKLKKPRVVKTSREEEPLIHKRVQFEFAVFFSKHSPKQVNRNLRDLIVHYLSSHPDGAHFRLDSALNEISKLMRILDKAEDYQKPRTIKEIFTISEKGNYYPELNRDDLDQDEYELISMTPV